MDVKLLLDTDIGTNIDDAVCLAYLLANPECDLIGITTVTGEAVKRAMMASAICKVAERDVPIYPGAEVPLVIPQRQTVAQQAVLLHKWDHDERFPKGEAMEFMRQTIREHPGEVILLTIAPLTNVGLLFSVDPRIPSLLKGVVSMCGRFFDPPPQSYGLVERNAGSDYHASSIVYRANLRTHRSIGLDVTTRVAMNTDEFRQTFRGIRLFGPVLDFADVWFHEHEKIVFHDPLAAATIFDESICQFEKGTVEIETQKEGQEGFTKWTRGGQNPKHEVAVDVNPKRFFDHFLVSFGRACR